MVLKRVKIILALVLLVLIGSTAWAVKGPPGVQYTVHNLSTYGPDPAYTHGNEEQVCIFCHTPHGADTSGTVPLWNRINQSTTYTHYVSAQQETATDDGLAANRTTGPESLACLSCHDGSVAVNQILNYSNLTAGKPLGDIQDDITIIGLFTIQGSKIGDSLDPGSGFLTGNFGDLFDDHPISFSYDSTKLLATRGAEFRTVGDAITAGVRFFGAGNQIECSSCHDPHVNYWNVAQGGDAAYTPFLITPNNGSNLCYACHIK